jgi:thiaminase/transcriptional activator TenA
MTERFTSELRRIADPIWEAQHRHPFVRGIGNGTLALDRFKFWMRQDYVFLIEYSRLLALAAARSQDLPTMTRFAELMQATLTVEMELHRGYAAEFGIAAAELAREPRAPVTQGYTDFLLRTAALGDYAELVAALLPCMWGFSEIGLRLAAGGRPAEPRYAKWIDMYADPEFAALAAWCRNLLDGLAEKRDAGGCAPLSVAFLTSSRYELAFWEMGWRCEHWPV